MRRRQWNQRRGVLGEICQERIHELALEGYMSIHQLKERVNDAPTANMVRTRA